MKNKILLITVLLFALLLAGCTSGNYSTVLSNENNTSTSLSMTYQKFDGIKTATFQTEDNAAVSVEMVSEEGKLNLSIEDMNGKSYYQGKDIPTSSFVVNLDKAGKYKVTVEGEKHTGSYKIVWGQ
jgi:PBP1b-binding outer membrane lipoprotein LpoB